MPELTDSTHIEAVFDQRIAELVKKGSGIIKQLQFVGIPNVDEYLPFAESVDDYSSYIKGTNRIGLFKTHAELMIEYWFDIINSYIRFVDKGDILTIYNERMRRKRFQSAVLFKLAELLSTAELKFLESSDKIHVSLGTYAYPVSMNMILSPSGSVNNSTVFLRLRVEISVHGRSIVKFDGSVQYNQFVENKNKMETMSHENCTFLEHKVIQNFLKSTLCNLASTEVSFRRPVPAHSSFIGSYYKTPRGMKPAIQYLHFIDPSNKVQDMQEQFFTEMMDVKDEGDTFNVALKYSFVETFLSTVLSTTVVENLSYYGTNHEAYIHSTVTNELSFLDEKLFKFLAP